MSSQAAAQVGRWRGQILRATELSSGCPLAEVLAAADVDHCYLVKALDVHPCLGKVSGRRLMKRLGLHMSVRLGELDAACKTSLVAECRCGRG